MTAVVEWRGYSDGFVLHGIAVVQTNQVAVEIGNFIDVYAGRGAVRCAGLAADGRLLFVVEAVKCSVSVPIKSIASAYR
jgi:hypothetical protein